MKKFVGKLDDVLPSKLINKMTVAEFDKFFLVLGLIYNDLKDLILFDILIRETYEQPVGIKPSVHAGEFSGVRLHIERLLVGLVSEFFVFIRENHPTISSMVFLVFLKSLDDKTRNGWGELVSIAAESSDKESFLGKLARIRSNIVFHYNYSGDELASGFINEFSVQEKAPSNEKAYFSLGNSMESTRFFYCDAAIDGYLREHLKIKAEEKDNYLNELMKKVSDLNIVIGGLMYKYIEQKKK